MYIDCVNFCVVSYGHINTGYIAGVKRPEHVADRSPHLVLSLRTSAAVPSWPSCAFMARRGTALL